MALLTSLAAFSSDYIALAEGELKSMEKRNSVVRTDFILQNIFAYVLGDRYQFVSISAVNNKEENVLKDLKVIVDIFLKSYREPINDLCAESKVTEDNTDLLEIFNELFCEGITWSHILALFVFVGEFTSHLLLKNISSRIVESVYECFYGFVKEKIEKWVLDHGGWEGLLSLQSENLVPDNEFQDSDSGCAKKSFV